VGNDSIVQSSKLIDPHVEREQAVSGYRRLCASASALILAGALGACAAYEKCGFGGCPGDAQLEASVRAAFEQHAELGPPNLLNIQSVDHVVYLYGLLDTDFQRQMAESVAHQVPGVTKVINSIGLSGNSR
jgi:osmotically-inducible protein OsmY